MTLHTSTTAKSVFLNRNTLHLVIPSVARDLPHGAWITLNTLCDPSRAAGSFSAFGMTSMTVRLCSNYSVTVMRLPTPRPLTLRSYIDSAKTGGTTNSPRLHDLI